MKRSSFSLWNSFRNRPLLCLVGAMCAAAARAQHIDNVTVSAVFNKPENQSPVPVTVIGDDELQQRAASTIGATLDSSPGVTSASFGPGVGQPVIRGQSGPRVQTLINGTTSADAAGVSADHAVAVEPMLAESIEVLRGPSTLLYGGGAIGGIVNVVDNRIPRELPTRLQGALELRHASVDDGDTSVLKLEGGAGQLAYHVDGVYRESNAIDIPGSAFDRRVLSPEFSARGFIPNTASRNHTLTGGLSWIGDDGYAGFSVSEQNHRYGIPLDAEARGDVDNGVQIDMKQKRYDFAGEQRGVGRAIDALRWRATYSDYQHREIENTGEIGTTFSNETWEGRFELAHAPLFGWSGALGVQLKRGDFAAIGEEAFIPESSSAANGVFVLESYRSGDFLYQLGARYDRDRVDPERAGGSTLSAQTFDNVSGSASVLWTLDRVWDVGLALSRSQRAPAIEELFSNASAQAGDLIEHEATHAIEVGDAGLDNETSRNIDLTLHYEGARAHGYITLFHNDFADFIALAHSGQEQAGTPILFYTQRDARFRGIEFELNVPLPTVGGAWSVDLYGDRTRGEFTRADAAGNDNVPRLPPLRIGTRLNYERGEFSAYAGVLRASRQDDTGAFESETRGYHRVDAGLSYRLALGGDASALLFARVTNLTDQTIRNSVSLLKDIAPEPGRSFETGIRFAF